MFPISHFSVLQMHYLAIYAHGKYPRLSKLIVTTKKIVRYWLRLPMHAALEAYRSYNPYGIRSAGSGCKVHAMESVISALTRTPIKPLASQVQIKLRLSFCFADITVLETKAS